MRESAAHGRIFDLGGIGTSGSVLFCIGFGGEVRSRYVVERMNPVFGAMRSSLMKLGKVSSACEIVAHTTNLSLRAAGLDYRKTSIRSAPDPHLYTR